MLPRYYLNDYFPLIDSPLLKEKEYMKWYDKTDNND